MACKWLILSCCVWLWCCFIRQCHSVDYPPDWASLNSIEDFPMMADRTVEDAIASEGGVCSDLDIRNSVTAFKKLENCSVVEGSVQILLIDKAQKKDFENMSFPKLKEITGYLLLYRVQGVTSLSKLFPNLAVIRGDMLFHNYAMVIYELRAIQDVGLINLTTILRGSVRIEKNPHLCYVDTIDWDIIAKAGRNGHFIKDNKPNSQCPKTCPEADCPSSPNNKLPGDQKLCWNSHTCQKVCNQWCELSNLTCSSYNQCCHRECIGGCNGSSSSECIACRNVVFQGKCRLTCPPGTYKYLNRRCIEEDECKKMSHQMSILSNHPVYWKPFHGECLPHCPPGYSVNESNKHQCRKCSGLCPKICDGAVIDSVGSAQKLKGCTFVNGSLEIQIQGGDNIIKELESSLSQIQEIRGYLKIARSYPLVSLNFLRDLRHIRGEQLDKKEYALLVLDNQNLQELWNWESRKEKLRISGGKVFFHFNSKLCLSKINELRNYSYVKDWDERDVSPSSNGDRVACDVVDMEILVWGIKSAVVGLKWKNFRKFRSDIDFRSLLGYVVYYREAPTRNVTIFDGRDACGADEWKVDDVEADDDSDFVITLLTHLKPFTTYAAYMRTYTIASALVGAQSSIIYFTTKPDTPSPPVNVHAKTEHHDQIIIQWSAPKRPNGNITYYIVEGLREKDSKEFISQRNYCTEPLTSVSEIRKPVHERVTDPTHIYTFDDMKSKNSKSGDCCPCNKPKNLPDSDLDAQLQISFEDFLQNNVFYKNPNPAKAFFGSNLNVSSNLRSPRLNSSSDSLNNSRAEVPAKIPYTLARVDVTSEVPTTIMPAQDENHFRYKVEEAFFLVVKNLHHFTHYTIEVKACQNANKTENEPCSTQAITSIRTRPLGGADDIDMSSIKILEQNLTHGTLNVKWDEPKDCNGLIVSYSVEIKSSDQHKPIPICVTQTDYQKINGYSMSNLMPGNYSLRLRATSLAGSGNWTTAIYFTIPNLKAPMKPEIVALLVVIVVAILCLAFGIPIYVYYKKKIGNDRMPTMLYASVNPEYMSAVYEPDEWEVARDKILLLEELGQGSFGMVYKGDYTQDDRTNIKCAVKTVNETASLRERIEFLQEASVMKAFNCHHVVKLLGVVSKGHPTLVIMELMGKGDLKAYLRSRRPDSEENIDNPNAQAPTVKEILQMAVEIADGMAYLTAKKFVHRDLAARNCMVSDDLTVKIGDFGMTRDIYETDYYRKGGKGLLPVRWMAPECLKDGLFSSQSDVWSYGIVLWEMATLASQPYQGLSNEQVLQYVISGGKIAKPEKCPEKLYAIMDLCWDKNPKARPTFIELIDMLLPDINKEKFQEVSFYFTQRQELCTKENELCEAATASTPMRVQWSERQNSREESDGEAEVSFFPPTRTSFTSGNNYHDNGAKALPPAVHSNDNNSKGMSATTSSDDSKGSKISSTSNGSIANGHATFAPGRTTMC